MATDAIDGKWWQMMANFQVDFLWVMSWSGHTLAHVGTSQFFLLPRSWGKVRLMMQFALVLGLLHTILRSCKTMTFTDTGALAEQIDQNKHNKHRDSLEIITDSLKQGNTWTEIWYVLMIFRASSPSQWLESSAVLNVRSPAVLKNKMWIVDGCWWWILV